MNSSRRSSITPSDRPARFRAGRQAAAACPAAGQMPLQPTQPPETLAPAPSCPRRNCRTARTAPQRCAHDRRHPRACRQKNAQEFLAGKVPGVMAQYAPGCSAHCSTLTRRHPAPDEERRRCSSWWSGAKRPLRLSAQKIFR